MAPPANGGEHPEQEEEKATGLWGPLNVVAEVVYPKKVSVAPAAFLLAFLPLGPSPCLPHFAVAEASVSLLLCLLPFCPSLILGLALGRTRI